MNQWLGKEYLTSWQSNSEEVSSKSSSVNERAVGGTTLNSAVLTILSGLPGSGKTTLAQVLARRIGAAHLQIDTIEQALRELCSIEVQAEGYRLAYRIASDILNAGLSVIADSCNPIELTRREWERVALNAGARYANAAQMSAI